MATLDLERHFSDGVCGQVRIRGDGTDRFRVFAPFLFDDGDHLPIVLKRDHSRWVLSDEANTLMRLTYEIDESDLWKGTRGTIINAAISTFGIENRDGELIRGVTANGYGEAFFAFSQAILQIADVTYLSRDRVKSTFIDDFHRLLSDAAPPDRCDFDWHHPIHDPMAIYGVDCRISGGQSDLVVHALTGDAKTRDATIALHQFATWPITIRSVAIFEDQEKIGRDVLARFSDVSGTQFSSIGPNRQRIHDLVDGHIRQ